jgi:hypothetical protein
MRTEHLHTGLDLNWWVKHGAIGGIIVGLVFALFEMVAAALMMGASAFWMPLRMIGAILLGAQALEPTYPLLTAAVAGVAVHVILSAAFGAVFAVLVAQVRAIAETDLWLITAATIFGFLLWLVNFYVIAPVFGWNWFPQDTNPVVQFIAHTFFYGAALGLYLVGVRRNVG